MLHPHAGRPNPHRILLVSACEATRLQYTNWLRRLEHIVLAAAGVGQARMHLLDVRRPVDLVVVAGTQEDGLRTKRLHQDIASVYGDRIPVLAAPGEGEMETVAALAGCPYYAWHLPPFGDWPAFRHLVGKALSLRRLLQFGDGVQEEIERRVTTLTARLVEEVRTLQSRLEELWLRDGGDDEGR